ncbi:30S ribosome-binding factor RbfA [Sphingomicrobium clamense]|uniref:Ribosome-binding factor A n=1 Tax=Sphingomicrobium clamense TaxID=2851013 RepID=A0ABS6V7V6_9SPHN|nr:30S ribosome-binding factor RbfA [Sphingomicrobium sp. B8]MBW0145599.1 30S ribosome-binding factor RbfA [Sphingomicrobium sp. B8]
MVQKRATSTEPSVRMLRMGEQVRHALAEVLMRGDVHDPALEGATISVTEVRMSPDLRHAMVFVKPLLGGDEEAVLTALKKNVRYLRGEVSRRVNQKYACDLKFKIDESFDEGSHIDSLLRTAHVARDLGAQDEGDGPDPGSAPETD